MFDDLITGNQYKKTLVNHDAKINFLSATFHQQDKLLSVIVVARVLIKVKSQIVLLWVTEAHFVCVHYIQ